MIKNLQAQDRRARAARMTAIARSSAVLGAIGISFLGATLGAPAASATPGGGNSQSQGTPGDHTDTNGQNDPDANHSASVEHANENADCNARGCDEESEGGGNQGGGNQGGGNEGGGNEGETPAPERVVLVEAVEAATTAAEAPALATVAVPTAAKVSATAAATVAKPATVKAAKPATVKAAKPAAVNGGVVSVASVPSTASLPSAVPAGGGSSAPQTDFPIWGIAMAAAAALAAAGAGSRLLKSDNQ